MVSYTFIPDVCVSLVFFMAFNSADLHNSCALVNLARANGDPVPPSIFVYNYVFLLFLI